jgi:cytidylate kinase
MAVLTISREIGSQGAEIGRMVAEKLNYHFADKQVMLNVFHQYGFKPFDKVYDKPTSFWDQFDSMRKMTLENLNAVIEALAHHGNMVIVGRGSFAVLHDLADVLNVRIQAPFDERLAWFMKEENLTDDTMRPNVWKTWGSSVPRSWNPRTRCHGMPPAYSTWLSIPARYPWIMPWNGWWRP